MKVYWEKFNSYFFFIIFKNDSLKNLHYKWKWSHRNGWWIISWEIACLQIFQHRCALYDQKDKDCKFQTNSSDRFKSSHERNFFHFQKSIMKKIFLFFLTLVYAVFLSNVCLIQNPFSFLSIANSTDLYQAHIFQNNKSMFKVIEISMSTYFKISL